MARFSFSAALTAMTIASLLAITKAHNYVTKPLTEFKAGQKGGGWWVDEFSPPAGYAGGDVSTGKSFMALAKKNGVSTVRDFIENRGPDCGYSNPNAKPKAIPTDGKVMLYRSMDHPGPCELWIDKTMIYHNDDCKVAFGTATPGFQVSFAACKGSCQLRFYWLGLQANGTRMQSYKNCIPLSGSGSTARSSAAAPEGVPAANNRNTNTNGNTPAIAPGANAKKSTNKATTRPPASRSNNIPAARSATTNGNEQREADGDDFGSDATIASDESLSFNDLN